MSGKHLQAQPLTLLPIADMTSRRPDMQRPFIPRGQTPVDNHRPAGLTYSNVAGRGIPNPGHAGHQDPLGGTKPQNVQAINLNQANMASQVANVNQGGAQMPGAPVANPGSNQMMPNNVMQTSGARFAQHHSAPFHQHQQHQHVQRAPRPLLTGNRPHNAMPNTGVQPTMNQQHLAQAFYLHQGMQAPQIQYPPNTTLYHNNMHQYATQRLPNQIQYPYQIQFQAQQAPFAQQSYPTNYVGPIYGTTPQAHYQAQTQPSAQMIPHHQQMHQQSRSTPVNNPPVVQPPPQQIVSMTTTNAEVSEAVPIPSKPAPERRARHRAILSDPNTGQPIDIEVLAKEEPKSQPTSSRSESFTGASSNSNALPTSTPKAAPNEAAVNIGLEFATKVAVAATEPIAKRPESPNVAESDNSLNTNLNYKSEAEESVAISKSTVNELSEANDKTSDICDNSTEEKTLVINTDSNSSNNVSNSGIKSELRQLNKSSAQSSAKSVSQVNAESVSAVSGKEINENGDINDTCNESLEEKEETPEVAKDHSIQKNNINNNNNVRKKEMIIKEDNLTKAEDVVDHKVAANVSDISITAINDNSEPQPKSDGSSPVMSPTESVDTTVKSNDDLNNSDNYSDKNEIEINKINEIKNQEVSDKEDSESDSGTTTSKSTLPDLPYQEDQWTPLNPEGKKSYDRDFLLAVRQKAESLLKMPESLMNDKRRQEIIRKETTATGQYHDDPGFSFMPNFAQPKQHSVRRQPQANYHGGRQSQPGRHQDVGKPNRKIIGFASMTLEVPLARTENPWKPGAIKPVANAGDSEELETLDLLKKIRGILNKLTPQKYENLVKQIISFKIDTEDRLKRVLDLIFEKAVDEPAFCLQYANLCKYMATNLNKIFTAKDDGTEEEVKFHKLLISKCQKEFEADVYASITDMAERQEEIDKCEDPQKKKMMEEILDERMRIARKRSLGNIKLIGELYKLNMLKANIMVQCIQGLITDADDESLECLCALFRTIGEQLEIEAKSQDKNQTKSNYTKLLDSFFEKMETIAEQKNPDVKGTSARVRFMLRDIIDMRAAGWRARRDEGGPKTIEEIHLDAQKEDEKSARDLHLHTINRKQEDRERKQKGGRQGTDDWTTIPARKSQNAPPPNIDWAAMRSQQQVNHENVQLGPQAGLGNWSMGSRGGAQSSSQSKFASKEDNRFAALDGNDARKSNSSRDSSKGRSNHSHGYQSGRSGNRSQRGDRDDAMDLVRRFSSNRPSPSDSSHMNSMSRNSSRGGSREPSAPNSRNSSMRRDTPELDSNPLKGFNISEDELTRKADNSIKEYLNVRDLNEAAMDVTALCNDSNVHLFVSHAINRAVESTSQKSRFDIGRLFDHLLTKNLIKFDHFFKGLSALLELEEDIVIDIPKFWEYIGEVLAPIFINLTTNRKIFLSEVTKCCKPDKRSQIVAKIFNAVSKFTDTAKAHELFVSSDLRWTDYMGPNANVEEFVSNHDVEFTITPTNSFEQFSNVIEQMVRQKRNESPIDNKLNDSIQKYIAEHFSPNQTNEPRFSSALFSGVIRGCINDPSEEGQYTYQLDKNLLMSVCPLLVKFLGGDAEKELQALIALQELMGSLQHPPNLLHHLLELLYENNVISYDSFLQWESSDNSGPSRAATLMSVVRFFTWLKENVSQDEESEEENDLNENS